MSATTIEIGAIIGGERLVCGITVPGPGSAVHECARDLHHDGPHRHPVRGEWLNQAEAARTCPDRMVGGGERGRCTRDPGHADYRRGIYWQAAS